MTGNEMTLRASGELETEADAYAFLERLRWGNDGPTICPHCGSEKGAWYLKPKDPGGRKSKGGSTARSQRRVWKCRENACRRQFSVLTNTVLHATKMPVRAWVGTVVDLCRDPAGVSARDVASRWNVTEKSAWAMLMRIEEALAERPVDEADSESNSPIWFEFATAQREQVEQAREHRKQAAAHALEARMRAEKQTPDRVEGNVQPAPNEAESGQPRPSSAPRSGGLRLPEVPGEKPPTSEMQPKKGPPRVRSEAGSKPIAKVRVADVPAAPTVDLRPAKELQKLPEKASETAIDPSASAAKTAIESPRPGADSGDTRRNASVSEQVKSDVERALAEAFGEHAPAPQPANPPTPATPEPVAAEVVQPRNRGTHQDNPSSKRRRKKRKRASQSDGASAAQGDAHTHADPVDNQTSRESTGSHRGSGTGASASAEHSRTQRRRRSVPRSGESHQADVENGDFLGGGWLDESQDERPNQVAEGQGKLRGIEAPELGPAWASDSTLDPYQEPVADNPFENQLDLFGDDSVTTHDD